MQILPRLEFQRLEMAADFLGDFGGQYDERFFHRIRAGLQRDDLQCGIFEIQQRDDAMHIRGRRLAVRETPGDNAKPVEDEENVERGRVRVH